jgi:hypothetical protein
MNSSLTASAVAYMVATNGNRVISVTLFTTFPKLADLGNISVHVAKGRG